MSKDTQGKAVDDSLEESIFKTLSHQKRRDILRVMGEGKEVTFTEIKKSIGTEDSPSLSYHLNALNHLIVQKEGKYRLSELGQDAYSLMCKTTTYGASNSTISLSEKRDSRGNNCQRHSVGYRHVFRLSI